MDRQNEGKKEITRKIKTIERRITYRNKKIKTYQINVCKRKIPNRETTNLEKNTEEKRKEWWRKSNDEKETENIRK